MLPLTVLTSATAVLTWTANTESDLAGYRVYYGEFPNVLNFSVDVGLTGTPSAPAYTISTFTRPAIWYMAVTAYDTSNNESAFSTVVSKVIGPAFYPMSWP